MENAELLGEYQLRIVATSAHLRRTWSYYRIQKIYYNKYFKKKKKIKIKIERLVLM